MGSEHFGMALQSERDCHGLAELGGGGVLIFLTGFLITKQKLTTFLS